uniref:C3H1-type domain-containing protein n=1 Tax=Oryza barthii TaxID=65489 RepID=A0A0D3G9Z8_9ORYZ
MASREHLLLDPAALAVSWADPAAVEIPPELLAALGEYLSARRSDGEAEADAEAEADDEFMMYEFKLWLHPSRYRTRPCRAGVACRRRVCFFAHTAGELRAGSKEDSPLSLSPKSTLASLWESPPVSPVEGRRWVDGIDECDADAEMEELMFAMRELGLRKVRPSASSVTPVLPPVTDEDGPDFGWVSELVM